MSSRAPASRGSGRALVAASACGLAGLLSACGGTSYVNRDRPPSAIVVGVEINNQRVRVSPAKFGAGPITLVIANRSGASQQVTLETAERADGPPGRRPVQTGPINPRETASVRADVEPGNYALRVGSRDEGDVRPARLMVGSKRPSSQNSLLTP
jgi:hypothetical protein